VTEPEDPFDTWLHTQVEPLRPPPGRFEQIRKRAKRRKMRRALMSAASAGVAAAVIVVAVVALPRLVPSLHTTPKAAANSSLHTPSLGASRPAATTAPSSVQSSSPTPTSSTGTATVPSDFAPTSVTFVNYGDDGWVLGQAPGCGQQYCTSVAETTNKGQTWKPIPAPQTGSPDGSTGVSQIRFLDSDNGWAFGPQLYETSDGGQNWQQVDTNGMRVTGLETVDGMAFAVFAQCTGTGADFAASCTDVSVDSSPAGSDSWTPMTTVSDLGLNGGDVSGKIVLTEGEGYFYAPNGQLYSGSTAQGAASWQLAASQALPCEPGDAQSDGEPDGGQLAAWAAGDLALACPPQSGTGPELVYTSTDGGQTWAEQGTVTVNGSPTELATNTTGMILTLSTTAGIYVSSDGGQSWKLTEQGPPGGFIYVGMTNATQGVAVPAEPSVSNSVWFTFTGGSGWQQSSLTNP
jgi:photosystem II stability/assembly factor-like uncharacterized protein